jgi:hypothetical protein
MIKRLAHRNANVQLYTLELSNALSQNCGLKIHKELASRSFTDALLRLANDRNTHQQVKAKILERMAEWTEMFASNPDLGIMEGAYMKLKTQSELARVRDGSYLLTAIQIPTFVHHPSRKRHKLPTPIAKRKRTNCRWRSPCR